MKDYIKLHISVLLAGFTGIFGKLIQLNEGLLVFYRLWFAFIILVALFFIVKKFPKENLKSVIILMAVGGLLGLHFLLFYGSIKYANVSVGVVCYSLVGFFTVIFEPLIERVKFSMSDLMFSLIAVLGIILIFNFDTSNRFGIILGILSAAVFALYTLYNKVINKSSKSMLFYELAGGALFVTLILPVYLAFNPVKTFLPSYSDFGYLLVLAFFCTIGLYILHIQVLKTISPFTVSLCGNLEPLYGIAIAVIFLGEAKELNTSFYIGMVLILSSVFLQSYAKNKLLSNCCKSANPPSAAPKLPDPKVVCPHFQKILNKVFCSRI